MAFYDALGTNDSAVMELGDDTLKAIARELVDKEKRAAETVLSQAEVLCKEWAT